MVHCCSAGEREERGGVEGERQEPGGGGGDRGGATSFNVDSTALNKR